MPLPLLPLLLAGGGAALGGLGAMRAGQEASETSDWNRETAEKNFEAAQKARDEAIDFARGQAAEDKLGVTDAYGNRVRFVPGKGWVTELSPLQQRIADLVQQEQQRQAGEGAIRGEMTEERMTDLARESGVRARGAGHEYDRTERRDVDAISDMLYAKGQGARNQAQDRLMQGVNRAMVRMGDTSNFADMVSSRAGEDADASREAAIDARLRAEDFATQDYNARRSGAANLLDQFRRGGAYAPNYSVSAPQGPQGQQSRQGSANLFAALQGTPPQMDYRTPNYGPSQAMASVGNTVSGLGGYVGGMNQFDQLMRAFQQQGGYA